MGKLELRIVGILFFIHCWSFSAWGQQWSTVRFEYKKRDVETEVISSFPASISYRLYYQVDGREARWIDPATGRPSGANGDLIDFSVPPGSGRLVLELKDLKWQSGDRDSTKNFLSIRSGVETEVSEGFANPGKRQFIIRNPDFKSDALVFPFDPGRISLPGSGMVVGHLRVQFQILTKGPKQFVTLVDFDYRLKFTPRAGPPARPDTLFPRAVEAPLPAPAAPLQPPVLPAAPGVDTAMVVSPAEFSVSAIPADARLGEVLIRLRHPQARRMGEFSLSFKKKLAADGSWQEVPYQNYNLQHLEEKRPSAAQAFKVVYRDFSPGEYLVLASRGRERDSTYFRIDAAQQPAAAHFEQEGEHLHLRVRGGEPPFQLQYRAAGAADWSAAYLNDSLYREPLLTCFEDLQDKIPLFKKNGAYDIRILTADGWPLGDQDILVIDRPWQGWRTLGWVGLTLLAVGIIASLRHWWWKSRTFYE